MARICCARSDCAGESGTAIGTGIAAGVKALEIAAVLTVFFSYATVYVYFYGDGLESDYAAQRKAMKRLLKETASGQLKDSGGGPPKSER